MKSARERTEEWRPFPGYETHYSVSSRGRVRRDVAGRGTFAGRILRPAHNSDGYPIVSAHAFGKRTTLRVHRAVAAAFIGPVPEGHEVNHKDGVKTNNDVTNLEYVTDSGNVLHAYATGLIKPRRGERSHRHVLTEREVGEVRVRLLSGEQPTEVARDYAVGRTSISAIKRGVTWGHLGALVPPARYAHLSHFCIVWETGEIIGPFREYRQAKRAIPAGLGRMGKSLATLDSRSGVISCRRAVPEVVREGILSRAHAAAMNAPAPGEQR